MMKSLICLTLILLPLISVVEGFGSKTKSVSITDVSALNIKEVAKYAIDEHNSETNDNLVLVKIVSGKKREVSATIYDLILAARDVGGATNNYDAVVMESGRDKILYSFNAV